MGEFMKFKEGFGKDKDIHIEIEAKMGPQIPKAHFLGGGDTLSLKSMLNKMVGWNIEQPSAYHYKERESQAYSNTFFTFKSSMSSMAQQHPEFQHITSHFSYTTMPNIAREAFGTLLNNLALVSSKFNKYLKALSMTNQRDVKYQFPGCSKDFRVTYP